MHGVDLEALILVYSLVFLGGDAGLKRALRLIEEICGRPLEGQAHESHPHRHRIKRGRLWARSNFIHAGLGTKGHIEYVEFVPSKIPRRRFWLSNSAQSQGRGIQVRFRPATKGPCSQPPGEDPGDTSHRYWAF